MDVLDVAAANVNEFKVLHLYHEASVDCEVVLKVGLQHEELFLQCILCLHSVVMLDGLLPHAHELPLLKLLEEAKLLNVIIRIALNQPLPQRYELNWHVVLVKRESLS